MRAMTKVIGAIGAAAALALPIGVAAQTQEIAMTIESKPAPTKSGYVEANGVRYYYELHGSGEPLLLLHGGLGSIDMFGPVLPTLAAGRQVVAIDLHGHGRTALGDRPIDLIDIGNDIAVVLRELGFAQVDVLGYSFGAGAGFRLAVQHPELVRRLVLVSGAFAQDGFHPEMLPMQAAVGAAMAESMKSTPMYESYMAVAPRREDFPRLLDRMGELNAETVRLVRRRQAARDAGDARLRRQRHVSARAHRRVLSTARRRAARRGLDAREHGAEPARDLAKPHALRHFPCAGARGDGAAVLERPDG